MIATRDLQRVLSANLTREVAALRDLEQLVRSRDHGPGLRREMKHHPCAVCSILDELDAVRRSAVPWS